MLNIKRKMKAGLELHIMPTKINTKVFSNSAIDTANLIPNQNIDCFELGMPGALPVLNEKFLEHSIKLAKALNCQINKRSQFYNKLYRYQDLPCRQITQTEFPIASHGFLKIYVTENQIKYPQLQKENNIEYFLAEINRIHIEHDAGRLLYDVSDEYTAIDYNRCGNGLLEIVTEPCFESMDEVIRFLQTVRNIVRVLDISECDMSKGEMRADLNFSVCNEDGSYGKRVEIKNLNSYNFIYKAGLYEYERHCQLLENGQEIKTETLAYDDKRNCTFSMRAKEDALDYRYFPNHDLPILELTEKDLAIELPKLPQEIYVELLNLNVIKKYAEIISNEKSYTYFFYQVIKELNVKKEIHIYSEVAKWIVGDLLGLLKEFNSIDEYFYNSTLIQHFAEIITYLDTGYISGKSGKLLLKLAVLEKRNPTQVIKELDLQQVSDIKRLQNLIQEILQEFPKEVAAYKAGKTNLSMLFMKKCLSNMPNANPVILSEIIQNELKK